MNQATRDAYQRAKEFEQQVLQQFGSSTDSTDAKARTELAQRDLEDIHILRATPAFSRYFIRRIATKRAALEADLKRAEVTHEQREIIRQKFLQLEAMENLLKTDEADCQRVLSPNTPMSSGPAGVPENGAHV